MTPIDYISESGFVYSQFGDFLTTTLSMLTFTLASLFTTVSTQISDTMSSAGSEGKTNSLAAQY